VRSHRPARLATLAAVFAVAVFGLPGCSLFDKKVDILLIGDSIMSQSAQFTESSVIDQPNVGSAKTHIEAINGSGLLTPHLCDQCDFLGRAPDLIDTYQPKVVVILFIGNYSDTDLWTGPDGKPIPNDYGEAFLAAWGAQAEKLTNALAAHGAQVDWVLPPPLAGDEGQRREQGIRRTYEALQKKVPSIALIDSKVALGGPNGEWVWRRAGVDGGEVTVRQGDSVHLTDDGGRLLAHQMALTIAPQLVAIRAKAA
jgi:hypothetical protein